jgi:hypothetical protein
MSLEGNAVPGQVLKGRINAVDILTISAYGIAVKNGFKGTEEEWLRSLEANPDTIQRYVNEYMEENPVAVDTTLSVSGSAADAKTTGKVISDVNNELDGHRTNGNNPHGVTAEQVGARPNTWMPTAAEVKARPETWTPTAAEVGARPDTWMPTASQVGARPSDWMPTASDVGAVTASQVNTIISDTVPSMINSALGVIENGTY